MLIPEKKTMTYTDDHGLRSHMHDNGAFCFSKIPGKGKPFPRARLVKTMRPIASCFI